MADRLKQLDVVQAELRDLFDRKNKDYGDAFAEYGVVGVLVRIGDKLKRAVNLQGTSVNLVTTEKVRDTLLDLANYATMAVMLLDEAIQSDEGEDARRS